MADSDTKFVDISDEINKLMIARGLSPSEIMMCLIYSMAITLYVREPRTKDETHARALMSVVVDKTVGYWDELRKSDLQ